MATICAFETLSDVSNRRLADIAGHDRGRLTWAESDGWPNGGNRRDNAAARGVANGWEANLGKGDVARFGAGHCTGSPGLLGLPAPTMTDPGVGRFDPSRKHQY
jgi:hypothetical protein